jgi:Predicted membrane protein
LAKKIEPEVAAALTEAVRELELCSCAEVVIEIRSRSGSYAHADARFGALVAFVALIVLLFSPWSFGAAWLAVDVAAAWVLGLFLSRKSDSVRHLMTTSRERIGQACLVAASVFHERGIANTISESGILVYLSLLEGHVEILADRGVLAVVPPLEWNRIGEAARQRHATTETLLEIVRALNPLLERYLPSREGDLDELCNVPRFVTD